MQKNIFELKDFPSSKDSLDESFAFKINDSKYKDRKKVFLSHKHSDLDKIGGVIDFFEKTYGVKCYIYANDKNMPSTTNRKTAEILKDTIKKADKFILIATEDAISSKWCNWELGLGDAFKYDSQEIAIFFFKNSETDEQEYNGNEYMSLYPYIEYRDGTTKYKNGKTIEKGYYVRTKKADNICVLEPLNKWMEK